MKSTMKILAGSIFVVGFSLTPLSYAASSASMSSTSQTAVTDKVPAGNLVKMQVR